MQQLKFRNLTKDEIEVRVGGGKSLLLYKTARVDANILDETVGPFNWQKRFYQVKNTMICEISINVNYNDIAKEPLWVAKADGGDDDYTMERVKAECSDSMKRAAFQWGIGRSLYTAPKIRIPDQFANSQFFDVEEIDYDTKGNISKLVITTNFGKDVVFSYPRTRNVSQTSEKPTKNTTNEPKGSIDKEDLTFIQNFLSSGISETTRTNFYAIIDKSYGTMNPEMLTLSQGKAVVAYIKRRTGDK